jgi:predicted flap endonuclease-1-like 5' DNA nuclease
MYDIACLRQKLEASFSLEELHTLCFDLGANYYALPGREIGAKSRELVEYFQYRNRLDDLFYACQEKRPLVNWDDCIRKSPAGTTRKTSHRQETNRLLEQVKGIGPTFSRRLQDAGIASLEQLAALSETELTEILQVNGRAATILAETDRMLNPPRAKLPRLLQKVSGIGPRYAQRLYHAQVETIEELAALNPAQLTDILGMRSSSRAEAILLEATKMILACQRKGKRLPLEAVTGIGPAFAQRLCRAGVDTIKELLWLDADKLAEILPIGLERAAAILTAARQSE